MYVNRINEYSQLHEADFTLGQVLRSPNSFFYQILTNFPREMLSTADESKKIPIILIILIIITVTAR